MVEERDSECQGMYAWWAAAACGVCATGGVYSQTISSCLFCKFYILSNIYFMFGVLLLWEPHVLQFVDI